MGAATVWAGMKVAPATAGRPRVASQPPARDSDVDERLRRIEGDMSRLARALADGQRTAATPVPTSATPPGEEPEEQPHRLADPKDYERAMEAGRQLAEERFRASSGESGWATQTEEAARSYRTQLASKQSISCRGALCRFETQHESSSQSEAFIDELEMSPVLMGATMTRYPLNAEKTAYVMFIKPNPTRAELAR